VTERAAADAENPLVQQRRLLAELRRIREDVGFPQKQVADALEWSVSKMIRIETGAVAISKSDLIALLHHYGVKDQKRVDGLIGMARNSRRGAWWDNYRDQFPQQFISFIAFEASSRLIRQFQALFIPGLLQTRDYARSIFSVYGTSPDQASAGVEVRLERQRVLQQPDPPGMFFILDEAVLRRWVGGPGVMREQLNRLKELNRRPHVTIQIVRFQAGAHAGMKGSFVIFELPPDGDYAVLLEYGHRDVLVQNHPEETSNFVETFYELEDLAEPASKTGEIIDEVLVTLPGSAPEG
jgi:transcriptional regulator with XRE-family HTH domain